MFSIVIRISLSRHGVIYILNGILAKKFLSDLDLKLILNGILAKNI